MKHWLSSVVGLMLISLSIVYAEPVSVSDVKTLAKAGIADEVIISQIRNAQAKYHLTTAELVDLKEAGVSAKVIDFMVNTTASASSSQQVSRAQFVSAEPSSTPPPVPIAETPHPFGLDDIKSLAKAGIGDEVIVSQIRNSGTIFRLNTAEIIDLKQAGVSNKVIDFLLNPPTITSVPAPAATPTPVVIAPGQPPPPQVEVITVSPGPDYMWVNGYWDWNGVRWVWFGGHWGHRRGDWGHGGGSRWH